MTKAEIQRVPIDRVRPNAYNPNEMDDRVFNELAADVLQDGDVDQPIVVRRVGDDYEIIDGEHRWRAAKVSGQQDILIVEKQVTDDQAKVMTVRRNVLRGSHNRVKFTELVKSLSSHGKTVEEVRKAMALGEREFARAYAAVEPQKIDTSKALSAGEKNMAISTLVANLSQMVREIFQRHGDTAEKAYVAFGHKGKISLMISCDNALQKAVLEFTAICQDDHLTQEQISERLAQALRSVGGS